MENYNIQIGDLVREMTYEEYQSHLFMQQEDKEIQEKQLAKVASRESALAKLAALGLTEEEIEAL